MQVYTYISPIVIKIMVYIIMPESMQLYTVYCFSLLDPISAVYVNQPKALVFPHTHIYS